MVLPNIIYTNLCTFSLLLTCYTSLFVPNYSKFSPILLNYSLLPITYSLIILLNHPILPINYSFIIVINYSLLPITLLITSSFLSLTYVPTYSLLPLTYSHKYVDRMFTKLVFIYHFNSDKITNKIELSRE